jgi:hypothetical protein
MNVHTSKRAHPTTAVVAVTATVTATIITIVVVVTVALTVAIIVTITAPVTNPTATITATITFTVRAATISNDAHAVTHDRFCWRSNLCSAEFILPCHLDQGCDHERHSCVAGKHAHHRYFCHYHDLHSRKNSLPVSWWANHIGAMNTVTDQNENCAR